MSKIQIPDISQQETWEGVRRFSDQGLHTLADAINGNLDFSSNINCQIIGITFSVANANTTIPHTLNRVPSGYILSRASAALSVYDGTTTWTASNIFLKSSAIGSVTLIVF